MDGKMILFYLLAAMTLGSSFLAVTSRMIFRSAIYLLFTLIGIAGLYFWLDYNFIAAVQIVVYVGGITVLIIFSIFLTQQAGDQLPAPRLSQQLFAALAAFCALALVMTQVMAHGFAAPVKVDGTASLDAIGRNLLDIETSGYALPFELISMLLLAALVGCIVIAIRTPEKTESSTETMTP